MKKPDLQDYGLSQNDLEKYKNQTKKYQIENDEQIERVNHYFKIALIVVAVIIVVIIIALLIAKTDSIAIFIVLGVGGCFEGFLGVASNYYYAHTSDWLYKNRKLYNQIVDLDLEKKVLAYEKDLGQFESEKRRTEEQFWLNLSGLQFEREVAKLFEKMGCKCTVTKATGDGGVDIIVEKNYKLIAVQCKHHKNKVGPNDVRALQGVVHNNGYNAGIFVSISGFTPTVPQEVASGKERIVLLSLKDLIELQNSLNKD